MADFDDLVDISAAIESEILETQPAATKSALDYFALAVTTFGVGYLPLAPGTWGSMVGVGIYLLFAWIEESAGRIYGIRGFSDAQITAWVHAINLILFLAFCLVGVWAAGHSTKLFKHKDPSQAVVDEVIGQLIVFLFVPFGLSWPLVLLGFLLFRLFDIWKPYPIDALQGLPTGIGVCADDILAGVYAGTVLAVVYAIVTTI